MSTEPVSDERLRQAVRDVLAEELDQAEAQAHDSGRTRREVLGSIAAGGVLGGLAGAGSAAGATNTNGTNAMVGALAGPPYQWADPGGYSGPDSAKSSISHSVGQVHLAQDTGARYYDNGSDWDLLPLRASRVNNVINAAEQSGSDLAAKVSNAESALNNGRGQIYVPATDDGSAYSWGSDLTLTPTDTAGYQIVVEQGVEIEYPGSGFPITIEDAGWGGGGIDPIFIVGGKWIATGSDPAGCFRLNDSRNCRINPVGIRDFTNTSNDAQGIVYRNVDTFCERNFSGWVKFSNVDICYDTEPASVTGGGGGTNSFVDNMWFWPSMQFNTIGMRFRGAHIGNVVDELAAFPQADNAVGVVLDGAVKKMLLREPRFDDPQDSYTNTISVQTGSNYQQGAYLRNDHHNNIDTVLDKNGSGDRVMVHRVENDGTNTRLEFGELDGNRWIITGTGKLELWDDTDTAQLAINNLGQLTDVPATAINGAGDYAIFGGDFYAKDDGGGLKVDTPDGNSTYRIRVDNSGNVVTDSV